MPSISISSLDATGASSPYMIYAQYIATGDYISSNSQSGLSQVVNQAATTIQVSGAPEPSTYGQAVTFTATVSITSPGGGTPTGDVEFYDGAVIPLDLVDTEMLSGIGPFTATYATTGLSLGGHTFYAVYDGDSNFAGSTTSSPASQTVNQASTSTTVTTSTGTATFFADGTQIGTVQTLVSGQAGVTISSLPAGIHVITVQYSGDRTYPAGTGSLTGGQIVNTTGISATTTVISNDSPSIAGQNVTFTATVTGSSETPTGTATFFADGTQIGAAQVPSTGQASISTSSLPVGTHTITVRYSGNSTDASNNGSLTGGQVVNPVPISTTTSVVSSLNPSLFGSSVTFTATVNTAGPGTPTGTLFFYDGATLLGRVELGGALTYTTSILSVDSDAITAVYSGDSNFAGSTSSVLTQVINPTGGPAVLLAGLTVPSSTGRRLKANETVSVKRAVASIPLSRFFFMKERKTHLHLPSKTLSQYRATVATSRLQGCGPLPWAFCRQT
jgi:Bacterial Ig-like domain (group 3)